MVSKDIFTESAPRSIYFFLGGGTRLGVEVFWKMKLAPIKLTQFSIAQLEKLIKPSQKRITFFHCFSPKLCNMLGFQKISKVKKNIKKLTKPQTITLVK